jgi:hypothetical protein
MGPYAPDEASALYKYLKGLNGNIKMYVSMQQPQTLHQAFQLAERCESTIKGVTRTPLPAQNNNQRYY